MGAWVRESERALMHASTSSGRGRKRASVDDEMLEAANLVMQDDAVAHVTAELQESRSQLARRALAEKQSEPQSAEWPSMLPKAKHAKQSKLIQAGYQ